MNNRKQAVGMMETLAGWARRTTSTFSEPQSDFAGTEAAEAPIAAAPGDLIYRLRQWPQLPASVKTAEVLRLLSLMSSRPLRRSWILGRTRLKEKQLDSLLRRLAAQQALDVIDPATLPAELPAR